MKRALVLVALTACGRLNFDPFTTDSDASVVDVAPDAELPCLQYGAWGAPQRIAELATSAQDYGSEISSDGFSLYWGTNEGGPDHLFVSTRPTRTSTWGPAKELTELGMATADPTITADGLEIFYSSFGGAQDCIWRASRERTTDPFSAGVMIPGLCGLTAYHSCAHVTGDGLTIVYGTGGSLYISTRPDRATDFEEGVELPGLNNSFSCPYITDDLLEVYYEELAPSLILYAYRSVPSGPFTMQDVRVDEAYLAGSDTEDVSLTADGLEMHFDSDRPGGAGAHDMYFMQRECVSR